MNKALKSMTVFTELFLKPSYDEQLIGCLLMGACVQLVLTFYGQF